MCYMISKCKHWYTYKLSKSIHRFLVSALTFIYGQFLPPTPSNEGVLFIDWWWPLYFNRLILMEKIINSVNYKYNYAHSFFGKDFQNLNIKVIRKEKTRIFQWKPQVSSSIEMINSGNYNYNYAHSFFGKDFKNVNIKSDQEEEKTHILLKTVSL